MIETIGRGGGAEQLLAALLPVLSNGGAKIEVVALFDWPEDLSSVLKEQQIVVHRLSIPGRHSVVRGLWRLRQLLRGRHYDVVWGHLLLGNLYARMAQLLIRRSKLVVTFHSKDFGRETSGIGRMLERLLLSRADRKVAVSDALRADYRQAFGWDDVEVIHNGVDILAIRELAAAADVPAVRSAFGVAESDFLIVTPARFTPVKGHDYLLAALRDLVADGLPLVLVLAGEGPSEDSIRAQVNKLGIGDKVRFAGLLTHDQLMPLMASADAIVLPSLYESFGLVPLEAMAAGAPVVATRVDGFLEVLGDSPAILVDPASADALADAIRNLLEQPLAVRKKAVSGTLEKFTINACARQWRVLFDDQTLPNRMIKLAG